MSEFASQQQPLLISSDSEMMHTPRDDGAGQQHYGAAVAVSPLATPTAVPFNPYAVAASIQQQQAPAPAFIPVLQLPRSLLPNEQSLCSFDWTMPCPCAKVTKTIEVTTERLLVYDPAPCCTTSSADMTEDVNRVQRVVFGKAHSNEGYALLIVVGFAWFGYVVFSVVISQGNIPPPPAAFAYATAGVAALAVLQILASWCSTSYTLTAQTNSGEVVNISATGIFDAPADAAKLDNALRIGQGLLPLPPQGLRGASSMSDLYHGETAFCEVTASAFVIMITNARLVVTTGMCGGKNSCCDSNVICEPIANITRAAYASVPAFKHNRLLFWFSFLSSIGVAVFAFASLLVNVATGPSAFTTNSPSAASGPPSMFNVAIGVAIVLNLWAWFVLLFHRNVITFTSRNQGEEIQLPAMDGFANEAAKIEAALRHARRLLKTKGVKID